MTVAWKVFLNQRLIDKVFYSINYTASEVRASLINHDGYDPAIRVVKERK